MKREHGRHLADAMEDQSIREIVQEIERFEREAKRWADRATVRHRSRQRIVRKGRDFRERKRIQCR